MGFLVSNARETLRANTIVYPTVDRGIASWPAKKGGYFAKIYQQDGDWFAVTNLNYTGPGLIVFINNMPRHGQKLKITRVSSRVAYADLV